MTSRVVTVWLPNSGPGLGFRRFELESPVGGELIGIRAFGYDMSTRVLRLWLGERLLLSCSANPLAISDQWFDGFPRWSLELAAGQRIRCDVGGRAPAQLAVRVQWRGRAA